MTKESLPSLTNIHSLLPWIRSLDSHALSQSDFIERCLDLLEERITFFLEKEHHKLLQILYQIDVCEIKVQKIFHESPLSDISRNLAILIVERQLEKFQTRKHYSFPPKDEIG